MGKVIPITVKNAEIKTATVEIRTLTVTGKQVTLAVFRQLREEPLINPDGTLNGIPWGVVNYHPDRCVGGDHAHVVWQRGSELLRATVHDDGSPHYGPIFWPASGPAWLAAHSLRTLKTGDPETVRRMAARLRGGIFDLSRIQSRPIGFTPRIEISRLLDQCGQRIRTWDHRPAGVPDSDRHYHHHLLPALSVVVEESDETEEQLWKSVEGQVVTQMKRRKVYFEAIAGLDSLPQLFIAV